MKISAFYEHLLWKVQDLSKVLGLACSVLGKMLVHIKSLRRFCRALYFQSKMLNKLVPGHIWLCVPVFERFLHSKISVRFRCVHCSFQGWVPWCGALWKNKVWLTEIRFSCAFAFPSTLHVWFWLFQSALHSKIALFPSILFSVKPVLINQVLGDFWSRTYGYIARLQTPVKGIGHEILKRIFGLYGAKWVYLWFVMVLKGL